MQISYSHIGKMNYQYTEIIKCGIWYFLFILLISLALNLFQHKQNSVRSKRFCMSERSFPSVFYLNGP